MTPMNCMHCMHTLYAVSLQGYTLKHLHFLFIPVDWTETAILSLGGKCSIGKFNWIFFIGH